MVAPISLVLTPQARPGGLRAVAHSLPDGWTRGVEVIFGSLNSPDRVGPCAVGTGDTEPKGDIASFQPVVIRQGIKCSALGNPDTEQDAVDVINVTAASALSDELYDGAATDNSSFADAVSVGTADNVNDAIAALEADIEEALSGRVGVIHVPLDLAHLVDKVKDNRTQAGNLVAFHGLGNSVYATGEVWMGVTAVDSRSYTDRRTNTSEAYADVVAIAVFDPEYIVSVTVTVPE